jgi:3-dehydroquinate dehydratase
MGEREKEKRGGNTHRKIEKKISWENEEQKDCDTKKIKSKMKNALSGG